MKSDEEYRAEAKRILELDQQGQQIELLSRGLRILDQQKEADDQMIQMDRDFFRTGDEDVGIGNHEGGSGVLSEGENAPS